MGVILIMQEKIIQLLKRCQLQEFPLTLQMSAQKHRADKWNFCVHIMFVLQSV